MRLFRRTEFGGLVVATRQELVWEDSLLRRRQDNESSSEVPAVPTSLAPIPPEGAATTAPESPNDAAVVSLASFMATWECQS
jgi:hypothetical protein